MVLQLCLTSPIFALLRMIFRVSWERQSKDHKDTEKLCERERERESVCVCVRVCAREREGEQENLRGFIFYQTQHFGFLILAVGHEERTPWEAALVKLCSKMGLGNFRSWILRFEISCAVWLKLALQFRKWFQKMLRDISNERWIDRLIDWIFDGFAFCCCTSKYYHVDNKLSFWRRMLQFECESKSGSKLLRLLNSRALDWMVNSS
jgi:hypothetical protein